MTFKFAKGFFIICDNLSTRNDEIKEILTEL